MIICPTCSTPNETGAAFCDQCGASLPANNGAGALAPAATAASGATCPVCRAATISGDAFCNECGAALAAAVPAEAAPVPVTIAPVTPAPAPVPVATPVGHAAQAQIVAANGLSVALAGKSSYLIGREDPVSGIYPEVDTTRSNGDAAGVSRRHAELIQQGSQWFLLDLNSTNGSFVNNQRVAPHTRHPLQPGDQIRLGKWVGAFQVQ